MYLTDNVILLRTENGLSVLNERPVVVNKETLSILMLIGKENPQSDFDT